MTLCALFDNESSPFIVSDTIATVSIGNKSLDYLSPKNFFGSEETCDGKIYPLFRKSMMLDPNSIMAFTGNGKIIRSTAPLIKDAWRNLVTAGLPYEKLKEFADPEALKCWGFGGVGVFSYEGKYIGTSTGPGCSFESRIFGKVHAIGSGAEEFNNHLSWYERDTSITRDDFRKMELNYIIETVSAMNNRKIFLGKFAPTSDHWGGYLEVFLRGSSGFESLGPIFHTHLILTGDVERANFGVTGRQLIYDNSGQDVNLVATSPSRGIARWPILDILETGFKEYRLENLAEPKVLSIIVTYYDPKIDNVDNRYFTFVLDKEDALDLRKNISDGEPLFPSNTMLARIVKDISEDIESDVFRDFRA